LTLTSREQPASSSIFRLVTEPNGEVVIVPLIVKSA
jgi:hypothetical protein